MIRIATSAAPMKEMDGRTAKMNIRMELGGKIKRITERGTSESFCNPQVSIEVMRVRPTGGKGPRLILFRHARGLRSSSSNRSAGGEN